MSEYRVVILPEFILVLTIPARLGNQLNQQTNITSIATIMIADLSDNSC